MARRGFRPRICPSWKACISTRRNPALQFGMPAIRLQPFPTVRPSALPAADVEGLYVHIPFCFHKCHYCDFYSITRQGEGRMERFVELVLAEAEQWRAERNAECRMLNAESTTGGAADPSSDSSFF